MSQLEYRKLHFDSLDEAMREADRLAAVPLVSTGNHTPGQNIDHLARTMDVTVGVRPAPPIPLPVRLAVRLMKRRIIRNPFKPGLKLPKLAEDAFWSADDIPVERAIESLQQSYDRFVACQDFPPHLLFGKSTREELEMVQCRHFELHLGMLRPA